MCTAISYRVKDHYFGRNLDLERSFHESVTIMPRNFSLAFRFASKMQRHHAMIGMAYVVDDYPLYYEATNEFGLSMAGLNFPVNAVYHEFDPRLNSVAPFEFIPWVLAQCKTVDEAQIALQHVSLVNENFSERLPATPLHWLCADADHAITIESMADGLHVQENSVGVLTNNPPFDYHLLRLNDFMGVSSQPPQNRFAREVELAPYSLGMGSIGLPGDMSSSSRFIRAAFVKHNSQPAEIESQNVHQFFHILNSAAQPKGCTRLENGLYEYTQYSSCCNASRGIYYYQAYHHAQIVGIDMHAEDLNASSLITYPMITKQQIPIQNAKGAGR